MVKYYNRNAIFTILMVYMLLHIYRKDIENFIPIIH